MELTIAFVLEARFQNLSRVFQVQNPHVFWTPADTGTSDKAYAVWCVAPEPQRVLDVKLEQIEQSLREEA